MFISGNIFDTLCLQCHSVKDEWFRGRVTQEHFISALIYLKDYSPYERFARPGTLRFGTLRLRGINSIGKPSWRALYSLHSRLINM